MAKKDDDDDGDYNPIDKYRLELAAHYASGRRRIPTDGHMHHWHPVGDGRKVCCHCGDYDGPKCGPFVPDQWWR